MDDEDDAEDFPVMDKDGVATVQDNCCTTVSRKDPKGNDGDTSSFSPCRRGKAYFGQDSKAVVESVIAGVYRWKVSPFRDAISRNN